jgi:hypothetical protein
MARSEPADGTVGWHGSTAGRTARSESRTGQRSACASQRARAPRYPQAPSSRRLAGRAVRSAGAVTDSRHSGTASSTVRVYRARWNAMNPRIQRVLTRACRVPVRPGGVRHRPAGVRQRADFHDQHKAKRALSWYDRNAASAVWTATRGRATRHGGSPFTHRLNPKFS